MAKTSKPKKRRVEKIGVSLLKGGKGKDHEIRFRGKEYILFDTVWSEEAKRTGKDLKADGYDVRFTKGTFDGAFINIYTRPAVPRAPSHRYTFGKRTPPISGKTPRITPKAGRLK